MTHLKSTLADDSAISKVLGLMELGPEESSRDGSLKTALQSAASAIKREREHQLSDALAFFPSTALITAGRQLLRVCADPAAPAAEAPAAEAPPGEAPEQVSAVITIVGSLQRM